MSYRDRHNWSGTGFSAEVEMMRVLVFSLVCLLAAPYVQATDDDRSQRFSLGGFSGSDTSGVAIGFYSLRPKGVGWYINGTVSSRVDRDNDDFRPIPGDIRVDGETESVTVNVGLMFALGPFSPYFGLGITQISEYGLYRAPSAAFWYEEKDDTEANFNVGLLLTLHQNLGLDIGANSANDELVLGLTWRFR
jgi:opacity protein-like surface antigen